MLKWNPGRAQRTGRRNPQGTGEAANAFQGHEPVGGVVRNAGTKDEQSAKSHGSGTTCLHIGNRAANRRARMDGVVNNGYGHAANLFSQGFWQFVLGRIESVILWILGSLRVVELRVELAGDPFGQERAASQGAAHCFDVLWGKTVRQLNCESLEGVRPEKQRIKVKPHTAMMAGLQLEMPFAGGQQTDDLIL